MALIPSTTKYPTLVVLLLGAVACSHPSDNPSPSPCASCADTGDTGADGSFAPQCYNVHAPIVSDGSDTGAPAVECGPLWLGAGGLDRLVDAYLSGGADGTYYGADLPSPDDPDADASWVRPLAFYYVLDVAVPEYVSQDPSDQLSSGDYIGFQNAFERVLLAHLIADRVVARHEADPSLPTDPIEAMAPLYAETARAWADALLAYAPFGGTPTWAGMDDEPDRAALMLSLAVAYDWLGPELDGGDRQAMHDRLEAEAQALYEERFDASGTYGWSSYPLEKRREATNTHPWASHVAIGVASEVLMDDLDANPDRTAARADAMRRGLRTILDEMGDDGGSHDGVGYGEYGLEFLLRYTEAVRTKQGDDSIYDEDWFRNWPKFLRYMTLPNGQRANVADSEYSDRNGPSYLMARLASEYRDPDAQRLAWLGHDRRWTHGGSNARGVLDLLWWDDTVPWTKDRDAAWPDHCFGSTGIVSVRTGWGDDDTALVYRGGHLFGGHDHPDLGSFLMYGNGHLVTDDGTNTSSKRTAVHSTFLVDGHGQHGDGYDFTAAPPEQETGPDNDGRLLGYLDASERPSGTSGSRTTDLVTFGSELAGLYQVYDGNNPHDGPTRAGTGLEGLERHVVWLGDAVLLLDRFWGTTSHRVDWNLATDVAPVDGAGNETDTALPHHCWLSSSSGYYRYLDGGQSDPLRFATLSSPHRAVVQHQSSGEGDFTAVNLGTSVPDDGACGATSDVSISGTKATIATAKGGELDVVALEPGFGGFDLRPSPYQDGSGVAGDHLARSVTGSSGTFLTALFPHDGGAAKASATATAVQKGSRLDVDLSARGQDARVWLRAPGETSSVTDGDSTSSGDVGVALFDGTGSLAAAQLFDGEALTVDGLSLVTADAPVDVSVTYGDGVVYGTVAGVTGATTITLATSPSVDASSVADVAWNGKAVSASDYVVGKGISLTVSSNGTFSFATSSSRRAAPGSTCRIR